MDAEGLEDGVLKGVEAGGLESFRVEVAGDGDIDYGAGGDVGGEQDGWEFDLGGAVSPVRDGIELDCARKCSVGTYQAFVLSQEDRDTGVDLANG